jgi:hypothetical protein
MCIFDIHLDIEDHYLQLIKDSYKIIAILFVFQLLAHYSGMNKNTIGTALSGTVMNDEFLTLVIFILLGLASYYLIFEKIVSFH